MPGMGAGGGAPAAWEPPAPDAAGTGLLTPSLGTCSSSNFLASSESWSSKLAPMKRCTTSPRGLMMPLVVSMAKHMNAASTRSRMSCSMKSSTAWAMDPKKRPARGPLSGLELLAPQVLPLPPPPKAPPKPASAEDRMMARTMPRMGEMMPTRMRKMRNHSSPKHLVSTPAQAMMPNTKAKTKPLRRSTRTAILEVMYPSTKTCFMILRVRLALSQKLRPVRPVTTTMNLDSCSMMLRMQSTMTRMMAPTMPWLRDLAMRLSWSMMASTIPEMACVPSWTVKAHVVARQTAFFGLSGSSGAK
mmetsp:Transcript_15330/g.57980  ORF Transcript_15330/g.57980 Transcript_15330/m.57980 type:complete len:302 (+) Transcript_15330:140-1045(+)